MMRYKFVFVLVSATTFSGAGSDPAVVRGFSVPAKTSVPYTYCIWYLPDPDRGSFLDQLRASPPDLFHLGYHIPFKGALGPTYGHELFTNEILSSDQIPREVERIQRILQKMRDAGVRRIIPYVYTMAFFGHPENRTGFFRFFDRWDEYRAFGLGPKAAADPTLWSQVRGPRPLGGGPPDVLHYEPCINHPAWSEYLDLVVRQLAAVGYDGMFFDVNTLYCFCPHCQEKFDIYLLEKYGRAGLRQIFGTDDHRELNVSTIYRDFERTILDAFKAYLAEIWDRRRLSETLGVKGCGEVRLEEDWRLLRCYMQRSLAEYPPKAKFEEYLVNRFGNRCADEIPDKMRELFIQEILRYHFREFLESQRLAAILESRFGSSDIRRRCCGEPRDLLLWVETQRFWCESMSSLFARLKRVGRTTFAEQGRGDDFYTVANLGSMATVDALNKRRVDAIDLVLWAPFADLQMFEEMHQPGSLESGVIISNVFAFRWAMGAGTWAGTLLYKVKDDRAADLAEAEVAAGGGGAFIQPGTSAPESRKRWKRFFSEHADLWDNGRSWARVGLLFWSDQIFYEYPEHLAMVHRLVHVLAETQVPFDIVTEENLRSFNQYEVVIAPMLRFLEPSQIEACIRYARQGGSLVVVEPFGTEDKFARPRQTDPLGEVSPTAEDFQCVACGEGQILRLTSNVVPARQSDLWCLMEERGNAFLRAREFLNQARHRDLESGVDLGPKFVRQLEDSLGLTLRWCPANTAPYVYVHAYRLPPKGGRPERLIVHAVNYHVPILLERGPGEGADPIWSAVTVSGEPVVSRDLRIAVPLPPGVKVKDVEALSPTDQTTAVAWHIEGNRVILTVDELTIYQALAVRLEMQGGQ